MNNPRRPLEASGTSGMKACVNGGLNLSVLDGWWCEAYDGENGWAIGHGEEYTDLTYQDEIESRSIYDLLEQEIVPAFYTRGGDGLPRAWIRRMKRCISTIVPFFNTNRMLQEYAEKCYLPSATRHDKLCANNLAQAAELAKWRRRLGQNWGGIKVESVEAPMADPLRVGADLPVSVRVNLGGLSPDEVEVQLFHGLVDSFGEISKPETVTLGHNGSPAAGNTWLFTGRIACRTSGQHGYSVRVLPKHASLPHSFEPGLVTWG
jgi:starch phosphorylase